MINTEALLDRELSAGLSKFSDKVILPQSVLSQIIDQYEDNLPHPLIFRMICNGSQSYLGVKEFGGDEQEHKAGIPWIIQQELGVSDDKDEPISLNFTLIDSIPKGTSLKLKPIKEYPEIHNWKYFLESKLRNYTTLTKGGILYVEDKDQVYELYVEDVEPANTVCIIDTDITLDVIEELQEDSISRRSNDVIKEIGLTVEVELGSSPVYKIQKEKAIGKRISVEPVDNDFDNVDVVLGDRFVSLNRYTTTTLEQGGHSLTVPQVPETKGEDDDDWVYLIPYVWDHSVKVNIVLSEIEDEDMEAEPEVDNSMVQCGNCDKYIPKTSLVLHENFCKRNNVKCTCGKVFLKKIPETHWECEHCEQHGDTQLSKIKHYKTFHEGPYDCPDCGASGFSSSFDLVMHHRATDCSFKLHECRFCHLIVPQEESTYEDKYNNLTHHEGDCGNKTTECFRCQKILKQKDIATHLKMHELEKVQYDNIVAVSTEKCSNDNCVNILSGPSNLLRLCDLCYGSIYSSVDDPTNLKLQNRIERKYVIQLSKGCGNLWCKNPECKSSGMATSMAMKDIIPHVRDGLLKFVASPQLPINKQRVDKEANQNQFWFCVDQNTTKRKLLVENLFIQGEYKPELVYKAVNEIRDISEDRIKGWLEYNAVKAG